MAALSAGKLAVVIFDEWLETFESQQMVLDKVDHWIPEGGMMQNAGNFIWRSVAQHAPVLTGWDLTGQEQQIIQETYPAVLGEPTGDMPQLRADNMRDTVFWKERAKESGRRQASYLNSAIATAVAQQGSLFVRSTTTSGYNFIAAAQAVMNERQLPKGERYFLLNDRDTLTYGSDLAARQTLQGRPADTWNTGQIGRNVAEFDVYTASFLPNITGGSSTAVTVTGTQSFAPEGGSVSATGVVTNVDYRLADIPVSASSGFTVGDKIKFRNSGVDVLAVGLDDKVNTNEAMTFTIVAKPDATTITVYPKPIAINDPALDTTEAAYGNINTRILNGATITRLNVDSSRKTNLFWDKGAIEVIGGTIPANFFKEFNGYKVINTTMKNGQPVYMIYFANPVTMQFAFRVFTWYGITVRNPSACGVAVRWDGS